MLGPWYVEGVPELPLGSDISDGVAGEPTFYSGRLLTLGGEPIEGGLLDVWSGDGEGLYDMQMPGQTEMLCRGKFRTDAEGRYWFRSIRPTYYPVPTDGPVGKMLGKMGRHPNRPGHIHMIVSAPGHETVVTHLFVAGAPYLDSDAVFAVKDSLIVEFEKHAPGTAPTGERMDVPFYTAEYDFRLAPAKPGRRTRCARPPSFTQRRICLACHGPGQPLDDRDRGARERRPANVLTGFDRPADGGKGRRPPLPAADSHTMRRTIERDG